MPTYDVEVHRTQVFTVRIEADSPGKARELVEKMPNLGVEADSSSEEVHAVTSLPDGETTFAEDLDEDLDEETSHVVEIKGYQQNGSAHCAHCVNSKQPSTTLPPDSFFTCWGCARICRVPKEER